jgi:hypothetical protein
MYNAALRARPCCCDISYPWLWSGGVYHTQPPQEPSDTSTKDQRSDAKRAPAEASDRREKAKAMELPEELVVATDLSRSFWRLGKKASQSISNGVVR